LPQSGNERKPAKNINGEKRVKIGSKEFDVKKHTYVMGILNVTPDSFSDG